MNLGVKTNPWPDNNEKYIRQKEFACFPRLIMPSCGQMREASPWEDMSSMQSRRQSLHLSILTIGWTVVLLERTFPDVVDN